MLHMQPSVLGILSALLSCLPLSLQQTSNVGVQNICRRWGHQTCVIDDRLYLDGGRISPGPDFESNTNQSSIMKSVFGNPGTELTNCQIPNLCTKTSLTVPASLRIFQSSTIICRNPTLFPPSKVERFGQTVSTRSFTSMAGDIQRTSARILSTFGNTTPSQMIGHPLKVHRAT